ncbi:cupin fold metalloprotein, WbuC family [Vibrio sp. S17_S38]|uniref:WbuC family cupin fold metalloprotein n=1 Tax=Vibrio sp. S17_S38 TaxID=2720229 RepID=UPI001681B51F|nr:WbuC family cupin fold metalloprotein [Vibrio sp. S17_S38]MBD1573260.1 cupin fold metalloprotein, WbuC family [Vibrio sp. S17_S38]
MKLIDKTVIEPLYRAAKASERKRSHYLLHDSHQDKVQRLLIGLVKGSYVEPHYHAQPHQWEMFTVLDGCIRLNLHSSDGSIVRSVFAGPAESVVSVELKPMDIHSLECISDKALILEVKEGPFDSEQPKSFL